MKSLSFLVISLATPILGGPLPQLARRADDRHWKDIPCDYGSLSSALNDPFDQWNDAKASEAYSDLYNEWAKSSDAEKDVGFSNFAADYFHTRPGPNCGKLDNANCEVTIECGQAGENAALVAPAAYMIMNSMVYLHQHYEAQYNGLNNALTYMNGEIGTFTSIFAPQLSQMKQNKIMIDILMMGFGVVSAGVFNSWMKNIPYFTETEKGKNRLGELKDVTNNWVANGMNIIKDSMSAIDELKVQNDMNTYLTTTVQKWVNATDLNLKYFMNESPLDLLNILVNGQMWDISDNKPDALDVTAEVKKTLYTYVIPYAWKMAYGEVGAFIATSEGLEGTEGDCKSWDPAKKYSKIYNFDDKYFESNRFCGDNGEVMWLLNMKRSTKRNGDCTTSAVSPGVSHCENPTFEQLPGWDTLQDGDQWGGVKRAEMVTAAVRAWKHNGKKNGWSSADPSTPAGQDEIVEKGTAAFGMVNIPVCSFDEAFGNAWPDIKTDNWPCS